MILVITNEYEQSITGTVYGTHTLDDTTIYVPSWMHASLHVHSGLRVKQIAPRSCVCIRMRPYSERFMDGDGALEKFNNALLNYKTLTRHTRILLNLDPPQYVKVDGFVPEKGNTFYVYNCGNVELVLLKPRSREQRERPRFLFSPASSRDESEVFAFCGASHVLGTAAGGAGAADATTTTITPVEAAAAAARRRLLERL
jgi:hypothetical protein